MEEWVNHLYKENFYIFNDCRWTTTWVNLFIAALASTWLPPPPAHPPARPPACLTHPSLSWEAAEIRAVLREITSHSHTVRWHVGETQSYHHCCRHSPALRSHSHTAISHRLFSSTPSGTKLSCSVTVSQKIWSIQSNFFWNHSYLCRYVWHHNVHQQQQTHPALVIYS